MDNTPLKRSFLTCLFLSSGKRRLRAGWRLFGQTVLLLLCLSLLGIPLEIFLSFSAGISPQVWLLSGVILLSLAITFSVYLARRFLDRRSFISLGLKWNALAARDLLFGIGLTGVLMGLVYLVEWAAGWLRFEGFAWQFEARPSLLLGTIGVAIAFVLVGWHEELISRGYWLQNLRDGLNLAWGVLISSALFALAHSANPNVSWIAILGLFASGLFLAYGYLRTRQLWLPIGLHIGWNFFEGTVFGFPVSGSLFFTLVRQTVQGPPLITGGDFGPEAGLIILPTLLLGAAAIYFYTRDRTYRRDRGEKIEGIPTPHLIPDP